MTYSTLAELNQGIWNALVNIREREYKVSRNDDHGVAYLIITGYEPNKASHNDNIINGVRHHLIGHQLNGNIEETLEKGVGNQDGAILVDKEGIMHRIGARLKNNTTLEEVAKDLKKQIGKDEAETLGFDIEVGTRHINGVYATYLMPDTYGFTLSGKTGDVRIYHKGKIIKSTIQSEIAHNKI